jgi:hypothetical protein
VTTGRFVFRKIDRNAGSTGESCGIDIDEDSVELIAFSRLSEASGNLPWVFTKLTHRDAGLSRRHHEIMQHDRCAVGPIAIQRCIDSLPSIQFFALRSRAKTGNKSL